MKDFVKDDMLFSPYPLMGGYQALIDTKEGQISVRFGGHGLFAIEGKYEVRYPGGEVRGDQTADDIFNYINAHSSEKTPKPEH